MILYSKTMHLILYSCHEAKSLTVYIYRYLTFIKKQTSCPVVIILNHSTYRNGYI